MSNKKVSTPPPCWFTEYDKSYQGTDFFEERESRLVSGYRKDIPLKEAIKIFNDEMLCPDPHQPFPLLTEEEVTKAAASGIVADNLDDADLTKRNLNLRRVVDEKVLAKGLLLRELNSDAGYLDSPEEPTPGVKKQFAFLYTGLDDNDMLCCVVESKQRLLIRELTLPSNPKK